MKYAFIIFFSFFVIGSNCISQEYNYYHYDVKDGLSGLTVYCIAQDKDGFLWFGTETGLSRFDGSHFKNFTANEGLPENEIINLFVDSKNRVWIFPFKSSLSYYYHGKIYTADNDTMLQKFHLSNEIFKACEDKNGNIFFLETDKLHILTNKNKLLERTKINNRNFYLDGAGLDLDGNCTLLVAFAEDLGLKKMRRYTLTDILISKQEILQYYDISRNAIEVNQKYTVVKSGDILDILDEKTRQHFNIQAPDHFHTLCYLNDSCFTVSTSDKTYLYNIRRRQVVDSFLTNKIVNRSFQDNEGNVWFATMAYGVYRLSSTKFIVYTMKDSYNPLPVYALSSRNSDLYIGTAKSLMWDLNIKTTSFTKQQIDRDYNIGRISSIQFSKNGGLLVGADNGIYNIYKNKRFNYFPRASIKNLFVHGDSVLIVSDRFIYDLPLSNFGKKDTIWQSRATCACKINGRFYIGTLSGLYLQNQNKITSNFGDSYPLLKDKIIAMATTPGGDLWVATGSHGLACLRNDKVIYHLSIGTGLTSNLCRCIYISQNNLWLGTDRGICKIDLSHYPFAIVRFTAAEGLDCEIINCIYAYGDSVFVGTPLGLTFFNAASVKKKSICELKLVDIQSPKVNWYYRQDSIHLGHSDNQLRFEYVAISYNSAGDIKYYYRINGLKDTVWQVTSNTSVNYPSLPSGQYSFEIRAINKYGVASKTITVPFEIEKQIWEKWWFKASFVLAAGFIIWFAMSQRIKQVRKNEIEKNNTRRQIVDLQQKALKSQISPHFIFNCLNSVQQYVVDNDIEGSNKFISDFSILIRKTLDFSERNEITLKEELAYLETYLKLEQERFENKFRFEIFVQPDIDPVSYHLPPLILQPVVENAVRHGVRARQDAEGLIEIEVTKTDTYLIISIKDNGPGIDYARKLDANRFSNHISMGFRLVQERIKVLNDIYTKKILLNTTETKNNEKYHGTEFKIKIPL